MKILENIDYHAEDIWYNKGFLAKISQYRNIKTFILYNNPILIYKLKFIPLKMKAYVSRLDEDSIIRIINLAKIANVPIMELITDHENTIVESFSCKINKSYIATYLIDLRKNIGILFSNCRNSRRNHIKKAKTEGVIVNNDVHKRTIDEWWDLYLETAKKGNFVPQNKALIYDLLKNGYCHLFTARKDSRLLAGALIVTNNYPYFWLGASSKKHPSYDASSLLQWHIIEWYKDKGYDLYDMGGASLDKNHGPTIFKKAFGGELIKTINYKIIFNPTKKRVLDFMALVYYEKLKKTAF